jgi:tripartite-type tricarboxylate transporter receptor subunit TctC
MNRRRLLAAAAILAAPAAQAQSWPARPIRLIVPNAAGGIGDLTARAVGQRLAELLGQPVVIENRPGAGGVVAAQALIAAAPDGHTLMLATNSHAIAPALFRALPYDPLRDLAPVVKLGTFAVALLVPPASALRDPAALLARLRERPGALNIGSISVGSTQHLAAELFKTEAGVRAETVTFAATPALVTALLRGDVDVAFEIAGPIWGQIASGELRPIAVTSATRSARLPDVPALGEAALPGFDVVSWNALVAPARTPEPVIARLNRDVNAALATPALRERLLAAGVEAAGGSPEAFGALLAADIARWRGVIERTGIERQ